MADLSIFKLDSQTITIKDTTARQAAESAKTLATTASGNATTALNKINELESEKADAIISSTSGAIASFPDGADGIPLKSCIVQIGPVQAGSGDPSPDNVRPISGWTGAKVTRAGKNLLDVDKYGMTLPQTAQGITWRKVGEGVYHVSGTATSKSYFNVSFSDDLASAMPVVAFRGKSLYLSTTNSEISTSIGYFREDGSFTNMPNGSVLPDEAVALRAFVTIQADTTIDTDFNIQLELGSTATDYEPYQSNTYDITFPTEAGTVYGGTLDVTNGVLTVDRVYAVFDGSSDENWSYYAIAQGNMFRLQGYSAMKPTENIIPAISNAFKPVLQINRTNGTISSGIGGTNIDFIFDGVNSLAEWREWLAENNVQLCYELATPTTYQLTPTEIRTLLGQNNICADTGDMSVTYRADTKLYIDKKFTELQARSLRIEKGETNHDSTKENMTITTGTHDIA